MIVIAIIGILAAALFPSMTNYLKRSRDAARTSNLKDISTAVGAYFSDHDNYPNADANGCVNSGALTTKYLPKGLPRDPLTSRAANSNGCTSTTSEYAYGSGLVWNAPSFAVAWYLENDQAGNTWSVSSYVGTTPYTFTAAPVFVKGSVTDGSGYVLMN